MSTADSPTPTSQNSFIVLCSPSGWSNLHEVIIKMVPQGKPPASAHDRRGKEVKKAKNLIVLKPQNGRLMDICHIVIVMNVSFSKSY